MAKWKEFRCENPNCDYVIGLTNDFAVIIGGTCIEQSKIIVICNKCGQMKKFYSKTSRHVIKFMTETEINSLVSG